MNVKNCTVKFECSLKLYYRVITDYETYYQDLMAQKIKKEENEEIYKKRSIT